MRASFIIPLVFILPVVFALSCGGGYDSAAVQIVQAAYSEEPPKENAEPRYTAYYYELSSDNKTECFNQFAIETNQTLDIMVLGRGYFELVDPDDARNYYYTRNGHFVLDNEGNISTPEGLRPSSQICVPQEALGISIALDGTITAIMPDQTTQCLGQITLTIPAGDSAANRTKIEGVYFESDMGENERATPYDYSAGTGCIVQGYLEVE